MEIFRIEVEREVERQVSEAAGFCEQLKSKDEAILAAEARYKDLQEQLEVSNRMFSELQERVRQLEATEGESRVAPNYETKEGAA